MALRSIRGVYRNGQIELEEKPEGITEAQVVVTFMPQMDEQTRNALRQRFFKRMEQGIDFGSEPLPTREEIYEERIGRYNKGVR